jgi:hypothetical protein
MTGTNCDLFTHKSSRSYLNHPVNWETADYNHFSLCHTSHVTVESTHDVMQLTLYVCVCVREEERIRSHT